MPGDWGNLAQTIAVVGNRNVSRYKPEISCFFRPLKLAQLRHLGGSAALDGMPFSTKGRRGDLAVSTAQYRISTVNRTMTTLRRDQCVKLPSPSKALGMQRTGVRHSVLQGQDREQVKQIVDALYSRDQRRAVAIVLLARAIGMRLCEAILADLPRLNRNAEACTALKTAPSAPRWISGDEHVRAALGFAQQVSLAGSRNPGMHQMKLANFSAGNHPPCVGHPVTGRTQPGSANFSRQKLFRPKLHDAGRKRSLGCGREDT